MMEEVALEQDVSRPLLIIISPLLYTCLSLPPELSDTPDQEPRLHILGHQVRVDRI
jgi:hypothetical protein